MSESIVHHRHLPPKYNLAGRRFGRLTVITLMPESPCSHSRFWRCLCDCGRHVVVTTTNLSSGNTKSCGCLRHQQSRLVHRTHGMSRNSRLYRIWKAMRARCLSKTNHAYAAYGGRGIIICDRWAKSFQAFYDDMHSTYRAGLSLDRIDNDGPYCPENCRWATQRQQSRNQRTTLRIAFKGETLSAIEWAERTGIKSSTIRARIARGWPIERVLSLDM